MKRLFTLVVVALMAAACGGTSAPAAERVDFVARSWPEAAPAECQATGGIAQIRAVDAETVEFQLCAPDVAFLEKIALTNFAIQDSGYLKAHANDGVLITKPNGTAAPSFPCASCGLYSISIFAKFSAMFSTGSSVEPPVW